MQLRSPIYLGEVAIEKGALGSPSTKVANFTYFLYLKDLALNNLQW